MTFELLQAVMSIDSIAMILPLVQGQSMRLLLESFIRVNRVEFACFIMSKSNSGLSLTSSESSEFDLT